MIIMLCSEDCSGGNFIYSSKRCALRGNSRKLKTFGNELRQPVLHDICIPLHKCSNNIANIL